MAHIERIEAILDKFAIGLLEHLTTSDISFRLQSRMKRAMTDCVARTISELEKIIEDKHRHPITYNHHYTLTIQKQRNNKNAAKI